MSVTNILRNRSRTIHFFSRQTAKAIETAELSIMYAWVMEDKADEGQAASEICRKYPTFSFVRSQEISMSGHLIFPAVSVHMQGSYIISARTLYSQNRKRLYLLFVDPIRLISGISHKLLWGKGQNRWVGKRRTVFWLFAQLFQTIGRLPV